MRPAFFVAGAGMAGLVAAVRAAELGLSPRVYEKGDRAGGSMVLSSGVIWRHRRWEDFRGECPDGDPALQRLVWERLDDALDWLRSLGVRQDRSETGNPLTIGARFDPVSLTDTLVRRLGTDAVAFGRGLPATRGAATVMATGGFAASAELVTRFISPAAPLRRRGNPWSSGDGLLAGLARGGSLSSGMDEFYGRNMPDRPWLEDEYVDAAQLYASFARIFDESGHEFFRREDVSWSELDVVQATARRPGARAFYLLDPKSARGAVRGRAVAEMVARAGTAAIAPAELPFDPPPGTTIAVRVVASITHTLGGLRVDEAANVLEAGGQPIPGLYAAGVDAGGIATGGYASGLAQALVLGLTAAETATRNG